jgi:hypothetical protein
LPPRGDELHAFVENGLVARWCPTEEHVLPLKRVRVDRTRLLEGAVPTTAAIQTPSAPLGERPDVDARAAG